MKNQVRWHGLLCLSLLAFSASAKIITVSTANNVSPGPNETNLVQAISLLADGDTIRFNLTGAGVHYIQTPADGYPLITVNNVTIDGYSQPGSSPNTASLHDPNNAQLNICLSSTNGNALSMYTAVITFAGFDYPNLGFGDGEQAVLGVFRATNVWIKGIAFIAAPQTSTTQQAGGDCKTITFAPDATDVSPQACQGFHVSGCWFGVEPTTRQIAYMPDGTTLATPAICIATYQTGTNGNAGFPNVDASSSGIIGVAPNTATPRAEFNVFVTGYGFDSQGGPFRISGNFWNVLPDGTTLADISMLNSGFQEGDAFVEFGSGHDILIGTDGDGVNDADEGNLFGSYAAGGVDAYYYGSGANTIMAGNSFGVDIHTNSFAVGQLSKIIHHLNRDATTQLRFGSDFNGVGDSLEANTVVDRVLFDVDTGLSPDTRWISVRGNSLVNAATPLLTQPPIGDGQSSGQGLDLYTDFIDVSGPNGTFDIIPVVGASTTTSSLVGTCGKRASSLLRVLIDLYEADTTPGALPQGKRWLGGFVENSAADSNPAEGAFNFNIASLGIAHGTQVTLTATYAIYIPTITSVSHNRGSTTLTIKGGAPPYEILGSTTADGTYSLVATTQGTTATFAAAPNVSFYRVVYHPTSISGSGLTSPFSSIFTIP